MENFSFFLIQKVFQNGKLLERKSESGLLKNQPDGYDMAYASA
ncbi:hypothetical protein M116_3691 [Bacteroides fragilis str. 3719 A10]|uniref:Uncharacterized protein n=5 Tax=Bacteroides fragilis TaxID=817 RepID=A0A015V1P4_BACFG|nr:hypothetical protein M080_3316 [Bacteroides fragilis str. 3397 T10]EXY39513.1 hypothetical protein M117_3427 [Bacteroides fragilis str. 3774 T13]EXY45162.1 hypothetical protein M118_3294 [Bacteroides fragilis str. 3783N1-2]EXY49921.1 hypothetical protein M121_3272 [Bacteroides fragilis str. 3783N2-1]EXY54664.1 hypothetical protein M122_3250 [Bacteroides fragilis str. 3976T7]EXY73053.1 hypothetical protein M124_3117 [Bacteroides fragilis str. 3988T(B)14]EXY78993.1 hypothetical protein M084_